MTLKRFPENDYHNLQNSYHEAIINGNFSSVPEIRPSEQSPMNYTAPSQIPPRRGRMVAIGLIAALLGYGGYQVWNSYLRYDSFGIVESDIVGIYPSASGFVQKLTVSEGSYVSAGDLVAVIRDKEDQRNLAKLSDEIEMAKADLASKKNDLSQSDMIKTDQRQQITGQLASETSSLQDLKSRLAFQKSDLARMIALQKQNAAGSQEVDSARFQVQSLSSLIQGKEQLLSSLKYRLGLANSESLNAQESLMPYQSKIAYLSNEKARLTEKIGEGNIYSPVSGVVTTIQKRPGEKTDDDPLFSVIVDGTTNLVLFYDPADRIPAVHSTIQVMSPSLGKMVDAKVEAVSKAVATPPDQIKRNYLADQKLVKVYLEPQDTNINSFVVGSIVKRPNPSEIIQSSLRLVGDFFPSAIASNPK